MRHSETQNPDLDQNLFGNAGPVSGSAYIEFGYAHLIFGIAFLPKNG